MRWRRKKRRSRPKLRSAPRRRTTPGRWCSGAPISKRFPEDPDDLASALQALAGPSAGPNGGQVYIDGFTGGRLPPRESIREIRVNQNPFAAEYDRPGFGRIEILTRPAPTYFAAKRSLTFRTKALTRVTHLCRTAHPFQQQLLMAAT
ncbi:MAG: hypothetical protein WKF84_21545 [Pyrinomonadaceae bacterium]